MAEKANAAIYFEHEEAYSTSGARLMGRNAAGEGFLRGLVRHGGVRPFYGVCATQAAAESFARLCVEYGAERESVRWIRRQHLSELLKPGTLYYPGPTLSPLAWRRWRLGATAFSLCGVTHTIASHGAMDHIASYQTAPLEPWDALVCTSRPVLAAVQRILDAHGAYLRQRFKAQVATPLLAHIPLGVDCEPFAPNPAARQEWRARLGIGPDDVAFLFMGRLSFHAKANPLPMYAALEQAAGRVSTRLHLIQAGQFFNDAIAGQTKKAATQLCPSVNTIFLDGRDADMWRNIWHAADVFTSLADNIQESFGLAPVEAMAAGLPVVVSDWDGYRDTVRHGIDGFRISTLMAGAPAGEDLAARHEAGIDNYNYYIGYVSQFVGVDIPECVEAFTRLASDAPLRRQMGAAARERARTEFDWSVIIARYQELWHELGGLRAAARAAEATRGSGVPIHPTRADPYWLFAGYPTAILGPGYQVTLAEGADAERLAVLRNSPLVEYAKAVYPSEELCHAVMERLAQKGACSVAELTEAAGPIAPQLVARAIVWMHKLGLVRVRFERTRSAPPAAEQDSRPSN